nr:putative retrotransposon protein [Tanacetum cinerariifolium]
SGSLKDLEIIQEEDTHPSLDTSLNNKKEDLEIDEPQSDIISIRRYTRTRHAPDHTCLYIDADEHELGDLGEPANYKAALLDPESEKWLNTMNVEMQSMKDNEVCVLVKLPPNGKTIGSKWLFKKKTGMDRNVHIYKARLVTKGYTQTLGIDYEETFSPVADIRAIRILIAIAAYYDYEIWQMDVKTAFLNGYLNEEVYMEQPEGFVNPKYPNRVCKLKCSIYGLKQALRQWNKRFDDEIKKFGFTQNRDDPCVYIKASVGNITFLILYVDDILIMGNSIPMLQSVETYLGKCFAMKDLGEAAYILGIKIYRDRSKRLIGLCQSAYIEKILKRYCVENSKRGSIPMQEKIKLSKSQGASTPAEMKRMQNVPYASAVDSIMNTKDMFLVYGGDLKRELRVSCYTDAGYLTDADDLKSQTGYVFVLNGGAVDWKSAKQSIFATSSAEAEYIAAFDASKEAVWVRKFIFGLRLVPTIEEPISMYCDNTGVIAIANESGITKGARHFRAKVYYLREVIEFGDIKLEKVHTDDNLADPFTKALAFPKHSEHTKNIGMLPASSLIRSKKIVEAEFRTIVVTLVTTMADARTMSELLRAPTEGYEDVIVIPAILADNFKLKVGLLQLVTSSQFQCLRGTTLMLTFDGLTRSLLLLTWIWLEKEPPRFILTWEDLVFDESFGEAWDRFKDLLYKCPHHGFSKLHQIDTFYNALTQSDQDSLNAAADGNLLNRTPHDALTIIENKSKVPTSRNKPIVSKATQQATVKDIEETCVSCGGPHPYYECFATGGNTFDACTAVGTYNERGNRYRPQEDPNYRVSNQMGPPGFPPLNVQNSQNYNQNRYNQNQGNYQAPNNHGFNQQKRQNFNQGNNNYQASNYQTSNNQAQVGPSNELSNYMKSNEATLRAMQTQMSNMKSDLRNEFKSSIEIKTNKLENQNNLIMNMLTNLTMQRQSPSGSGSLLCDTVANPRGDVKAITTRSGVVYEGPSIPPTSSSLPKEVEREPEATKDKVQTTSSGSTVHVQPPVVQVPILEPEVVPKPNPKPSIPYPSRLNNQKLQEKMNN